ncbi:hypothetical protein [Actinacidiphila glaucinigra]
MDARSGQDRRIPKPSERALTYAEEVTLEDVSALETFLYVQLKRVCEEVGETGETSFAMRSLLILISDSAGFLRTLITVERPEMWQRAAIVREWQRLRSAAHDFNHCEGYDHDRWWRQLRHFNARDEATERDRIRQAH